MADMSDSLSHLGDFAVFLSDDPLPIRPSAAAEEAAAAAEVAHLNPKHFSPTKDTPAWSFGKPQYPRIKRKMKEGMENVDDIKLPCGNCDCKECKLTYRSYWEEKSYSKELNKALLDERKAMSDAVEEMGTLERDYKDQISRLRLEVDIVNERVQSLEGSLEFERKLRADETYRREITNEESKHLENTQSKLEAQLVAYSEELVHYRNENAALKEAVENSHRLREKTLEQVRKYESMSNALERDNSEVKTALYQVELELNKALLSRDNLKQRLNTVTDYWGNPKKQPQKQGQQQQGGGNYNPPRGNNNPQQQLQGGGSTALSLLLQEDSMIGGGGSHGKKKTKQQHGALSRITREIGRAEDRGSHGGSHNFSQLLPISTAKRRGGGQQQQQQQHDRFMPNNVLEGSTMSSLGVGSLVFDRDY